MALKDLLKFVELTRQFQKVERPLLIPNEQRKENDLEHSAKLALTAWYFADSEQLQLDMLIEGKKDKVAVSNETKPYFDPLVEVPKKEEHALFPG
ncbi:MAG: hypothetical protein HY393_03620, partial [Candidatus Diapherotrites archaeon]|nr:hypothetical protein [Candidatus Diapherotrites archaeon]